MNLKYSALAFAALNIVSLKAAIELDVSFDILREDNTHATIVSKMNLADSGRATIEQNNLKINAHLLESLNDENVVVAFDVFFHNNIVYAPCLVCYYGQEARSSMYTKKENVIVQSKTLTCCATRIVND